MMIKTSTEKSTLLAFLTIFLDFAHTMPANHVMGPGGDVQDQGSPYSWCDPKPNDSGLHPTVWLRRWN